MYPHVNQSLNVGCLWKGHNFGKDGSVMQRIIPRKGLIHEPSAFSTSHRFSSQKRVWCHITASTTLVRAGAKEPLIIYQNLLTFLYLGFVLLFFSSCGYKIILVLEAKYFVCRSPLKILGVAS